MAALQTVANAIISRRTSPAHQSNRTSPVRDRIRRGELVPVTLVSTDLDDDSSNSVDHQSTDNIPTATPDPLTTSLTPPPLKRAKLLTYKRRLAIRYKRYQTVVNGRLALFEHRLPHWVQRYLDRRRVSKWDQSDAKLWYLNNGLDNHWDALGNGNVLSTDSTALPVLPPAVHSTADNTSPNVVSTDDTTPSNDSSQPPLPPSPPTIPTPPPFMPIISAYSAGSFMGAALGTQPSAPPHAFDEHYRAFSVAMMPRGGNRDNVAYGGKILMPPSALARLTTLNFPSPWMFQLRNPENAAASTHAGVLEFIADEGIVFLPHWMMKTLKLNEGDAIRVTGASLPKGKFVKLQAQETSFVEVSDPKAVLEQALRNFTCLTQGDIIEISYNTIVFGLLVMETRTTSQNGPPSSRSVTPSTAPGISVFDTDLEVDFATPKGWKDPVRPPPKPVETMASRLGLDPTKGSGKSTPAGSRPGSSLGAAGGIGAVAGDGDGGFEAFKGRGETLNGRKTKGKGVKTGGRKITEVDPSSKIERTDKAKFITSDMLDAASSSATAGAQPLNLEFGQLFFGYPVVPYTPPATPPTQNTANTNPSPSNNDASNRPAPGIGLSVLDSLRGGNTLSGKPSPYSTAPGTPARGGGTPLPGTSANPTAAAGAGAGEEGEQAAAARDWGSGNRLGTARSVPREEGKKKKKKREVIELD